jgi:hypothetical protein
MDFQELQGQILRIEELVNRDTKIWKELIERGLTGYGEAPNDIAELREMNKKMESDLMKAIEKDNMEQAVEIIESIYDLHDRINYQKLLESNKVPEELKDEIARTEEELKVISGSTVKDLKNELGNLSDTKTRPAIIFEKSVLFEIEEMCINAKEERSLEYGALLVYERVDEGLLITDFEEPEGIQSEINRAEDGIDHTEKVEDILHKTPDEQRIFFHSHPVYNFNENAWKLSSSDKSSREKTGQGILVVATVEEPEYSQAKIDIYFWAVTAVKRSGHKLTFNQYLPLRVSNQGEDITKKFPLIQAYNNNIPKSAKTGKNPYKFSLH